MKILSRWNLILAFLFFLANPSKAYSYVEVWNFASFGGGTCGYCGDEWGYSQDDNKNNPTYADSNLGAAFEGRGEVSALARGATAPGAINAYDRITAYAGYAGYTHGVANTSIYVQDAFTVFGRPTGTAVHIAAIFAVTGGLHSDLPGWAKVWAGAKTGTLAGGIPVLFSDVVSGNDHPISTAILVDLDVSAGIPFSFSYGLGTNVFLDGSGSALERNFTADFGNSGLLSFDLPEGTWISSDGGFSQVPVPEPATLLLLGSGLAGFGIWFGVCRRTSPSARRG